MKKILVLLSVTLLLAVTVMGCGKYEPKLSELGVQYVSKNHTNEDGSFPGITVKSVTKEGDNIIIQTETPFDQIQYALNNFLAFQTVNEKGTTNNKVNAKIENKNDMGEIIVTGEGVKDAKYIQVIPYKNKDNQTLEFEIK
ncbi:hypothetical protein [Clostridium perfringens]|uniref:hypothetical protein n=1 Tax=Clostridium perfringens TaxID=1502 RepID=UPI00096A5B62|nr:hypothetical protein [Clostridium perfringens]MDM0458239.1 hypothetical protein [Clostridium perfringens]